MSESTWNVPVPTFDGIMVDKNIDLRLLAILLLISKRDSNGICNEPDERYIYNDNLADYREEIKNLLGFSESTYKRKFKKLRDSKLIRHAFVEKDGFKNLVYFLKCKLKVGDDYKYFTLIKSDLLEEVLIKTDLKAFKIYCLINYKCNSTKKPFITLTQNWFAKSIGFSLHSKDCISSAINSLEKNKFINILEERFEHKKEFNNRIISNPTIRKYYSLTSPEVLI